MIALLAAWFRSKASSNALDSSTQTPDSGSVVVAGGGGVVEMLADNVLLVQVG